MFFQKYVTFNGEIQPEKKVQFRTFLYNNLNRFEYEIEYNEDGIILCAFKVWAHCTVKFVPVFSKKELQALKNKDFTIFNDYYFTLSSLFQEYGFYNEGLEKILNNKGFSTCYVDIEDDEDFSIYDEEDDDED